MKGTKTRTWNDKHVKEIDEAEEMRHLQELDLPQHRGRHTLLLAVYYDALECNNLQRSAM